MVSRKVTWSDFFPQRAAARDATTAADLDSAEAQVRSPQSKTGIVRAALESVQRIAESAAGGAAAPEVAEQLGHLTHVLSQLPS